MRILVLTALLMAGTCNAAYQPGALAKVRQKAPQIAAQVLNEAAHEVVAEVEQDVSASEFLALIEREITYMLTHNK